MRRHLAYTALWVGVFGTMMAANGLGDSHPGHSTRFWQQACEEGRRDACAVYGRIVSRYCGQGSGWACNEAGMLMVQKRLADNSRAEAAFQSACALEFTPGCLNRFRVADGRARAADPLPNDYALILSRGKGPLADVAPEDLLDRACHEGWVAGCGLLGLMKISNVTNPDKVRGAELLQRACDQGHAPSCANLAFAYKKGDGVAPDPAKVLDRLKRACDLGMPEACRWLEEEKARTAVK